MARGRFHAVKRSAGGHRVHPHTSIVVPPYRANAVNFDGNTSLHIDSLTAVDGPTGFKSFWFKKASQGYAVFDVSLPGYHNFIHVVNNTKLNLRVNDNGAATFELTTSADVLDETWKHLLFAWDTDHVAGQKQAKIYINDVDLTVITGDNSAAFSETFNSLAWWVGSDSFGSTIITDMAQYRFQPGPNILVAGEIPEATRRLFFTADGKPVDPEIATAQLGDPAILFDGDAASFAFNKGPGGQTVGWR